ncbi:hypothetical protein D9M71_787910 [compost metagenome]
MGGGATWAAAITDKPANARLAPNCAKRSFVIVMLLIAELLEGMNSVPGRLQRWSNTKHAEPTKPLALTPPPEMSRPPLWASR